MVEGIEGGSGLIQCPNIHSSAACVDVCASPGAWNAAGRTGNISLIWPFVLLSTAHLSQQRKLESNKC